MRAVRNVTGDVNLERLTWQRPVEHLTRALGRLGEREEALVEGGLMLDAILTCREHTHIRDHTRSEARVTVRRECTVKRERTMKRERTVTRKRTVQSRGA